MTIAIIGGSGFIGTELTYRLLEAGHSVVIADRARSIRYSDHWVAADVRQPQTLRAALRAQNLKPNKEPHKAKAPNVIYNLAAEHKDNVQPRSLYDEVNVQGARNVCAVAEELGINRMVFTSSVAVYGFAPPNTDESGELQPFNDYGRTKLEAEHVYREWMAGSEQRSLTIVRPTVVFGPRNRGNVYNLLRQMASGRFAMVGTGNNVKSMAYINNIAEFLARALDFGPGEHLFNYIDKPDLSMNELVALVRKRLGRSERPGLHLPYWIGYTGGLLLDGAARVARREFPISAIRVKKFCATTQFRSSRIDTTGFKAPVSLREGLDRTIDYEFLGGRERDTGPAVLFESE